jgi:hypothetical protein
LKEKEKKELRQRLGVTSLQPAPAKITIPVEHILAVLKFAEAHRFVLDPGGYEYRLRGYLMFKRCPCAPDRKFCPCDQAGTEVMTQGHCKCRLFWRSYADYIRVNYPEKEEKVG